MGKTRFTFGFKEYTMKYAHGSTSDFYKGARQVVKKYLKETKRSKKATWDVWAKGVLFMLLYFGAYTGLYLASSNLWLFFALYAIMGISGVLVVFNLVHDASHQAISKQKWINRAVCYLGDLLGINTYIWDIRHNIQHHAFTNVVGGDIIIESIPLIRLSPHQPYHKIHRFQPIYAPILYSAYSFFWMFVIDFRLFFKKTICNLKDIKHPRIEWIKLILFKLVYITYTIILPIILLPLPWYTVLLGYLLMHITAGLLLSTIAVLGHFVEGTSFPETDENEQIPANWSEHELEATIDFAPNSRLAHALTGGLNTHIVHHLFPHIGHGHYYELTQRLQRYCTENGYLYKQESFMNALRSHFRYLKRLSTPPVQASSNLEYI